VTASRTSDHLIWRHEADRLNIYFTARDVDAQMRHLSQGHALACRRSSIRWRPATAYDRLPASVASRSRRRWPTCSAPSGAGCRAGFQPGHAHGGDGAVDAAAALQQLQLFQQFVPPDQFPRMRQNMEQELARVSRKLARWP
jgi:hypothetical protein